MHVLLKKNVTPFVDRSFFQQDHRFRFKIYLQEIYPLPILHLWKNRAVGISEQAGCVTLKGPV